MNFCERTFKSFVTGKIEVVCDGTSNGLSFTAWNCGLTNEVEIVGAASGCQPLYCSNPAENWICRAAVLSRKHRKGEGQCRCS